MTHMCHVSFTVKSFICIKISDDDYKIQIFTDIMLLKPTISKIYSGEVEDLLYKKIEKITRQTIRDQFDKSIKIQKYKEENLEYWCT